jgi:hypothetical protein
MEPSFITPPDTTMKIAVAIAFILIIGSLGFGAVLPDARQGQEQPHRAGAGDAGRPVDHAVPADAGAYKMGYIHPTGIRT